MRSGLLKSAAITSEFPTTQINMSVCQCIFTTECGVDYHEARHTLYRRCFGKSASVSYFWWLRGFLPEMERRGP